MITPVGNFSNFGTFFNYNNYNTQNNKTDPKEDECETCNNRRYQDKSNDGTVSFQMPTKMNPSEAAHMVRAHEQEHVRNEQQRAAENGGEVVAQSVRILYSTCYECGDVYVAGGETRTITKYANADFGAGLENPAEGIGDILDTMT